MKPASEVAIGLFKPGNTRIMDSDIHAITAAIEQARLDGAERAIAWAMKVLEQGGGWLKLDQADPAAILAAAQQESQL